MIARAAGIGVMFLDDQGGSMVQKPVEDMGRLTHGGRNDLGVKRPILIGDMRIEEHPRVDAVFCVDLAGAMASPSGPEELAIRR